MSRGSVENEEAEMDPNELLLADEPCIEHIQTLRALSRHLSRCEATYYELFADD